ncbi:MAG: AbrB/MazE/SpoVT family DNA-binding domain-containing protein [Symploca sp. SIO1A3]|nr:AbrB/MazE/SpoVT family DNA-binding domain-containing protein [Symploca sp. SIO1A3]
MKIAKLLMSDHHQTVALPKEFQFQGNEVYINKIGSAVVLISKENPWETLFDSLELFSEDFMETREQTELEVRETLE